MLHEIDNRNLIEEYKFCHEKAIRMENNIWTTASIFAIGSIVGIATLSNDNVIRLNPHLSVVVGLLAIGGLLTWRRFARRWWSIQGVMLKRMKEIEISLGFNINLYIKLYDDKQNEKENKKENEIILKTAIESLKKSFENLRKLSYDDHEQHGIRPMVSFYIIVNMLAWVVFIFFQSIPDDPTFPDLINKYTLSITPKSFVIFIFIMLFGFFLYYYNRKKN